MARALGLSLLVLACACGPDDESSPPTEPEPAQACVAGELTQPDGSCLAAGVPPEACGEGFESDGALGCRALLPAAPCPPGQMALPGDSSCGALADCGQGDFGAIPIDATSQHVNEAYAGGDSDGTAARPWTTIGAAVAAAAPGVIVAVAAGSYAEDVVIQSTGLRLWGRCPEMVEIAGVGTIAAVRVAADSAEVRSLAVRGTGGGVVVTGAIDVVVEDVWVHDTAWHGVHVEALGDPASATVRRSLFERAGAFGIYVYGAAATAEDVMVRDTSVASDGRFGYGLHVEDKDGVRAALDVSHAWIERSSTIGIGNVGSDLSIRSTLVRDTLPSAVGQLVGRGINAEDNPFTGAPATLTVDASLVELSRDHGIYIAGVTATITHTVVRDTLPEAASQEFGRALNVLADYDNGVPSNVTVKGCLFERSLDIGVGVFGSVLDAELVVVRQTQLEQATQHYGYGIVLQDQIGLRSFLSLRSSVVEDNQLFGVVALGSDAQVSATRIARTLARPDGIFGDGIAAISLNGLPASAAVYTAEIEANARAAVAVFGANLAMGATTLDCNPIDLHIEAREGIEPLLDDLGTNACSCQSAEHDCKASSAALEPPEAVPAN